ncbi:hypothetical protein HDU98_001467 [Podochytrium sp. JEL0797]|nr:hypothetical protein HDU98_001467 [Podochytrium sp. JEL0797]
MLSEYFSMIVSEDGQLESLPVLLKGYEPNLGKLPLFLIRVGTEVDWTTEQGCFDTFCRELGIFYACEPPYLQTPEPAPSFPSAPTQQQPKPDSPELAAHKWTVEHVVFKALKQWYLPSREMAQKKSSVVQVVDLPDLYKDAAVVPDEAQPGDLNRVDDEAANAALADAAPNDVIANDALPQIPAKEVDEAANDEVAKDANEVAANDRNNDDPSPPIPAANDPIAIAIPPTPAPHRHEKLTPADRDRLIDQFCLENNLRRSDLTKEQLDALHHRFQFMQEHAGHESQHASMAMILLFSLVAFQLVLTVWKRTHKNSFNLVSLVGLWFVPAGIAWSAGNARYLACWALFSVVNGVVVRKAIWESPMRSETPRLVYRWYSYVYSASVIVGAEEVEISMFRGGVTILFYALYFGMLGRDFVDRLSDRMALNMGYHSKTGFPKKHLRPNVCAICGESTAVRNSGEPTSYSHSSKKKEDGASSSHGVIKMNCGHPFHEDCIRGWTIIGKKDCCPYCKEKQLYYLNFLDALRYFLVWNPVVFVILHFIFKVFGFK